MKNDVLGFDYEPLHGQVLKSALGCVPLALDDGSVSYDEVRLTLDSCSLSISVDVDTDEVICNLISVNEGNDKIWVNVDSLSSYVGLEIGWLWLSRNWMGYTDMMSLSFSGIDPNIALVGSASKLSIFELRKALTK